MAQEPEVMVQTGVRYPSGDENWLSSDRFLSPNSRKFTQEEFDKDCEKIKVPPVKLVFLKRIATTTYTEVEIIE